MHKSEFKNINFHTINNFFVERHETYDRRRYGSILVLLLHFGVQDEREKNWQQCTHLARISLKVCILKFNPDNGRYK